MRRGFDKAAEQSNMNIVTAFAHGARLTLGITQSARGGGGIAALRELIEMLDIRGITIYRRRAALSARDMRIDSAGGR